MYAKVDVSNQSHRALFINPTKMDKKELKKKISWRLRDLYDNVYFMESGNVAHNKPPALDDIFALGKMLYEEGLFDVENKYVREKFGLPND